MPRQVLEQLLRSCTCEAPFKTPDGRLYLQIEGVAMGSPLGVSFANFYMCDIENKVLLNQTMAPTTYCRYIDDIYTVVRDETHLKQLKTAMEQHSVLKFTYELSVNNKLPFLDIAIDGQTDTYVTSVYRKPTDTGRCLNSISECPERYKVSVIRTFLRRALKTCSDWLIFQKEVERIKQVLINNGYSNRMVDSEVNKFLSEYFENPNCTNSNNNKNNVKLFYCNQMNKAYKTDERIIKSIILNNVKCRNPEDRLNLIISYKNKKISNPFMKNNLTQDKSALKQTNVIYQFNCPVEDCALLPHASYIGMTRTSLSRRLTMHLQTGNIKTHMQQSHNSALSREQLVNNTKILQHCQDPYKLQTYEALIILENNPIINIQATGIHKTLKLFSTSNHVPPANIGHLVTFPTH